MPRKYMTTIEDVEKIPEKVIEHRRTAGKDDLRTDDEVKEDLKAESLEYTMERIRSLLERTVG